MAKIETEIAEYQNANKWAQPLPERLASLSAHEHEMLTLVSDLLLEGKTDRQLVRLMGWDRRTVYTYASTARLMWAQGYQLVEGKAQQAMELRAMDAQLADDLEAYTVGDLDGSPALPKDGMYLKMVDSRLRVKAQLAKLVGLDSAPTQTIRSMGSIRPEELSDEALEAELAALPADVVTVDV